MKQSALMCVVQGARHSRNDLDDCGQRHPGGMALAREPVGVGSVDVVHRDP
jgi:hypothetical protein